MKSEIRNPKSEGNPKPETRNPKPADRDNCWKAPGQSASSRYGWPSDFGFRISDFFRTSDFGLRTSALLLCLLLIGCKSVPPNSLATHNPARWEKEIAALEAHDRTNPPPRNCIVFVGSSSIRLWKTLAEDFPGFPVVNHGFGGSQLADSVHYADRIIVPAAPRQVVIYAGGNDINAGKAPEIVYGDFVALVTKIRAALPDTQIAYIASAPNPQRWSQVEKVKRLNSLAEAYCHFHDLTFINVFPLMLGPDGLPKPDIFVADRLHMNPKGYAIWREAVGPCLLPK
jgi:lysophospholipase L1-like esterase